MGGGTNGQEKGKAGPGPWAVCSLSEACLITCAVVHACVRSLHKMAAECHSCVSTQWWYLRSLAAAATCDVLTCVVVASRQVVQSVEQRYAHVTLGRSLARAAVCYNRPTDRCVGHCRYVVYLFGGVVALSVFTRSRWSHDSCVYSSCSFVHLYGGSCMLVQLIFIGRCVCASLCN